MLNFIKNFFRNYYFIYFVFTLILITLNIIFIEYWIIKHPYQIDNQGNLLIDKIQFNFDEPINNLINKKNPSITLANIEFKISKMPIIIYFLHFFQIYISKNFITISLFKNIFLSSIIFILLIKYDKKLNNLFLICCLLLIYSVPHNIVNMLSITPEESILIYFIIILFFLITGDYRIQKLFYINHYLFNFFYKGLNVIPMLWNKYSLFYF